MLAEALPLEPRLAQDVGMGIAHLVRQQYGL
jgi:hypothetical protein